MKKKLMLFSIMFLCIIANLFSQSKGITEFTSDFDIEGVKLGCDIRDFLTNAKISIDYDSKSQMYYSFDFLNINECYFKFFGGKLYLIIMCCDPKTILKNGGAEAILNKIETRFGEKFVPFDDVPGVTTEGYVFQKKMYLLDSNRMISAQMYSDGWLDITLADNLLLLKSLK